MCAHRTCCSFFVARIVICHKEETTLRSVKECRVGTDNIGYYVLATVPVHVCGCVYVIATYPYNLYLPAHAKRVLVLLCTVYYLSAAMSALD